MTTGILNKNEKKNTKETVTASVATASATVIQPQIEFAVSLFCGGFVDLFTKSTQMWISGTGLTEVRALETILVLSARV